MKNSLPLFVAILLTVNCAYGWGPDQLVNSISPQGKVVSIAKSVNLIYTAIPSNTQPGHSILIFNSTDGGLNWNPVSYVGTGKGMLPLKMKAIRSGDSVYVYFLESDSLYHVNLETGLTRVVPLTYSIYDFDVTAGTNTNGVYLYYMPVNTAAIRRVSSADRGITWAGSSALVTSSAVNPVVTMYGSELILNYTTPGPSDTAKGVIRAAHYHETIAGQIATGTGGFSDIETDTTTASRLYQSVVFGNTVWFFRTQTDANGEQLICKVSGDLSNSYGPEFNLNPNPLTESIFTFDAMYNDGPVSGCDVYYIRHANGNPAFAEVALRSALTLSTFSFSAEVVISDHSCQSADPRYLKPAAVRLPGVTEHAITWNSNMPSSDLVYFDRESFITGLSSVEKHNLDIYPSPAVNFINIKTDTRETFRLELFNMQGQSVILIPSVRINNQYTLDISGLNTGNYMVRLTSVEGSLFTGKILKTD